MTPARARLGRVLTVATLGLAAAGCWPAPGADPDRSAHNPWEEAISPATVADLAPAWTATLDAGGGSTQVGPPVVSSGLVHAPMGSRLHGVDLATGTEQWHYPAEVAPVGEMGPVTVVGERVLAGHGFGNLGGHWNTDWVDAATGAATGSGLRVGLVDGVRGTTVLTRAIAFGSGTPVATNIAISEMDAPGSGWTGTIDFRSGGPVTSALTLGETHAYQAGPGAVGGNSFRAFPVSGPLPCPPPAPAGFACPAWSVPLDGATSTSPVLAADGATAYTATNVGTLYAIDTASHAVLWTAALGAAVPAPPALADDTLYVPVADGRLVALPASGCDSPPCTPAWSLALDAPPRVQPAVAGGVVFAGTNAGTLVAADAAGCGDPTCDPLWSADTGDASITGAPAVTGGRLYAGTNDARVVAFALPS